MTRGSLSVFNLIGDFSMNKINIKYNAPIVFATEDFEGKIFDTSAPCSYKYAGISASAAVRANDGEEVVISNYSSLELT